jgi:hypothetical protein
MKPSINLAEKLSKISDTWSPRVVAELNDYQFKESLIHTARLAGERQPERATI